MLGDEAPGLGDDAGRVEGRAPVVLLAALRVGGPAVEEVGAVVDGVADLAAQEGVHGQSQGLAEGVQAGDLEAGDHGRPRLAGRSHAPQPARVDALLGGG